MNLAMGVMLPWGTTRKLVAIGSDKPIITINKNPIFEGNTSDYIIKLDKLEDEVDNITEYTEEEYSKLNKRNNSECC